jgi:hypothetical protein
MLTEYTCFAKCDAHPELALEVKVHPLEREDEWTLIIQPKNMYEGAQVCKLPSKCMAGIFGYGSSENQIWLDDIRNSKCVVSYFSIEMIKHLYELMVVLRKDIQVIYNASKETK